MANLAEQWRHEQVTTGYADSSAHFESDEFGQEFNNQTGEVNPFTMFDEDMGCTTVQAVFGGVYGCGVCHANDVRSAYVPTVYVDVAKLSLFRDI